MFKIRKYDKRFSGFFGILVALIATVWNNETVAWYVYLGFGGFALACILVGMIIMRYTAQTQTAWKIW